MYIIELMDSFGICLIGVIGGIFGLTEYSGLPSKIEKVMIIIGVIGMILFLFSGIIIIINDIVNLC